MNHTARHLLHAACIASALAAGPSRASEAGYYAYVSAEGEVHLTNLPDDERYQRIDAASIVEHDALPPFLEGPPYRSVVAAAARKYGIEPALLHAVITVESGYNARAVSRRGAAGLMQLMPATARRLGVADVFNPVENVHAGARYLMELLQLFNSDIRLALAAYNAGEAAVVKYGNRIPPYRETVAYVPKVVRIYRRIRGSM